MVTVMSTDKDKKVVKWTKGETGRLTGIIIFVLLTRARGCWSDQEHHTLVSSSLVTLLLVTRVPSGRFYHTHSTVEPTARNAMVIMAMVWVVSKETPPLA